MKAFDWILLVLAFLFFLRAILPGLVNNRYELRLTEIMAPHKYAAFRKRNRRYLCLSVLLGLFVAYLHR